MKLYKLSAAYQQLWSMVDDPEVDLDCLEDTISGIEGDIEDKAENIVKFLKSLEATEKALKEEEERLYNKRKTLEARRERLKNYLDMNLRAMGIKELRAGIFSLKYVKNPPSIKVDEDNEELKTYQHLWIKQPDKFDRKTALEQLKEGKKIPGCELYQGESLRIR